MSEAKKLILGTWEEASKIMRKHGFLVVRGKMPRGLSRTIREMLTEAYIIGYSKGYKVKK